MTKPPKQLQNKWSKILKDSGFVDIENNKGNIKEWSRSLFQKKGQYLTELTKQSAKQDYYRLAGHFLYEFTNFTEANKPLWDMHSQGMSIREISKVTGVGKSTVGSMLKSLSNEMIRMYSVQHEQG
jgi:hypothetical protein